MSLRWLKPFWRLYGQSERGGGLGINSVVRRFDTEEAMNKASIYYRERINMNEQPQARALATTGRQTDQLTNAHMWANDVKQGIFVNVSFYIYTICKNRSI